MDCQLTEIISQFIEITMDCQFTEITIEYQKSSLTVKIL